MLQLLTSDLSERDIGRELYVSHNTVHSHVRSIYRKLGVSSRAHALERTRALGLPCSSSLASLPICSDRCFTSSAVEPARLVPCLGRGRPSRGGRAGVIARLRIVVPGRAARPPAALVRLREKCEVGEHLDDEHDPGGLGFGGDVPETHLEKTVTVKYRASVRVSGWVKLAAEFRSITKYVEANTAGRTAGQSQRLGRPHTRAPRAREILTPQHHDARQDQ